MNPSRAVQRQLDVAGSDVGDHAVDAHVESARGWTEDGRNGGRHLGARRERQADAALAIELAVRGRLVLPQVPMNFIIDGEGELVNEAGDKKSLKSGDFAMVLPNEKHQYRNTSPDKPFVMICGVPKEFE